MRAGRREGAHWLTSRLASYRKRAALTQAEVGRALAKIARQDEHNVGGVIAPDQAMVSKWERGVKPPSALWRRCYRKLFNATDEELGLHGGEVQVPQALAKGGMLEWLSSTIGLSVPELKRVVDARSLLVNRSSPPEVNQDRLADLVLSFYGPDAFARTGFAPYQFRLGGQHHSTTVATRSDWLNRSIPLGTKSGVVDASPVRCFVVPSPIHDEAMADAVIDRALNRLARQVAASDEAPVMVDRPLYDLNRLMIDDTGLEADFSIGSFAHYALTYDLLEEEASEAVLNDLPPSDLQIRSTLMPDLPAALDLDRRLCAGGVECLVAIARPATGARPPDFVLPVQERSARVVNVWGLLTVIPKAFHQHLVDPVEEAHLGATVRRELEEELFGREDVDEGQGRRKLALNPYHPVTLSGPMKWLDDADDCCSIECTAAGIDLVNGTYTFACAIAIQDERFWAEHGGSCVPNWEADGVQVYSSHDEAGLAALLADPRWERQGLFTFVEGLKHLAERFPDRVTLPSDLEVLVE